MFFWKRKKKKPDFESKWENKYNGSLKKGLQNTGKMTVRGGAPRADD